MIYSDETKAVVASIIENLANEYGLEIIKDTARDYWLNTDRKSGSYLGKEASIKNNKVNDKIIKAIKNAIG